MVKKVKGLHPAMTKVYGWDAALCRVETSKLPLIAVV